MLMRLRARVGYLVARRLMASRTFVERPGVWRWMEGQFARMAALGDVQAQSFYGHLLLFRGKGLGARQEGIRLLKLAAEAGEPKAAYQMGAISLSEDATHGPDGVSAARWWHWRPRPVIRWRRLAWRSCTASAGTACRPMRSRRVATRRKPRRLAPDQVP